MPAKRRFHERRTSAKVCCCRAGAALEKQPHNVDVAVQSGGGKRSGAVPCCNVNCLGRYTHQALHHAQVALAAREMKRVPSIAVGVCDVGSRVQQLINNIEAPSRCRGHKRRPIPVLEALNVGAACQQNADTLWRINRFMKG